MIGSWIFQLYLYFIRETETVDLCQLLNDNSDYWEEYGYRKTHNVFSLLWSGGRGGGRRKLSLSTSGLHNGISNKTKIQSDKTC